LIARLSYSLHSNTIHLSLDYNLYSIFNEEDIMHGRDEPESLELLTANIVDKFDRNFKADGEYLEYLKKILGAQALNDVTLKIQAVRETLAFIHPSVVFESQKSLVTEIKKSLLSMSATIKSEYKKNKEKLREAGVEINVTPINILLQDCNDLVLKLSLSQQQLAQPLAPARARSNAVRSNSSGGGMFSEKKVDESLPHKAPHKAQSAPDPAKKAEAKPSALQRGGWGKK
jgi:hypothetical protein